MRLREKAQYVKIGHKQQKIKRIRNDKKKQVEVDKIQRESKRNINIIKSNKWRNLKNKSTKQRQEIERLEMKKNEKTSILKSCERNF